MIEITKEEFEQLKKFTELIRFTEDNYKNGCGCTISLERVEDIINRIEK